MSEMRKFLCVSCPVGCALTVEVDGINVLHVEGHTCPRGTKYAENEVSNPLRVFSSTVRVEGGALPVCPVRSAQPIPLNKIFDITKEVARKTAQAPLKIGQVIVENVCGTGVDIVTSRSLRAGM